MNDIMWYCSLCNLDLGEISTIGKQNEHPTCPYCHGAVEEEGTIMVDLNDDPVKVSLDGYPKEILEKVSELSVERMFELITMSLDDSPYSDYREDIVQILKVAFEPHAKIAYLEIGKIINENFIKSVVR
jgi:hypothetical protein